MGQRILGGEPSWEWDEDTRQLRLFPGDRTWSGSIIAKYISSTLNDVDPVKSTDLANDLKKISFRDLDLLLRYYIVELKERLGRVRGKYADGFPAAGGDKRLDGDTLLAEVQTDRQMLNEEIMEVGGPTPPFLG